MLLYWIFKIKYLQLQLNFLCETNVKFFFWQIAGVDKFVSHVNVTLRHKHDQERLNAIVAKIESYDAVESPNDECLRVSHDQISKNCELNCRQIWKERNINKKLWHNL